MTVSVMAHAWQEKDATFEVARLATQPTEETRVVRLLQEPGAISWFDILVSREQLEQLRAAIDEHLSGKEA